MIRDLFWFVLGWASILFLKYIVFGITAWNDILHPGLIPAPNQQPYLEPFLGLFSGNGSGTPTSAIASGDSSITTALADSPSAIPSQPVQPVGTIVTASATPDQSSLVPVSPPVRMPLSLPTPTARPIVQQAHESVIQPEHAQRIWATQ